MNNQSEDLITYKWEQGIYSLKDLIYLVKYHQITPEDFFNITRYSYQAMLEKYKIKK